ncbi:MAG: hypothetical protein Q8Q09_06760 [Deltaproteobacteria bacterium]|nr:hypothetical protein [Deltaproteobacteria bacterium]
MTLCRVSLAQRESRSLPGGMLWPMKPAKSTTGKTPSKRPSKVRAKPSDAVHLSPLESPAHSHLEPFDRTQYSTLPMLSLAETVALGTALLNALESALPGVRPEPVQESANELRALLATRPSAKAKPAAGAHPSPRDADAEMDNAWGALIERLKSYARLPAELYPKSRRAVELLEILAPDGLSVLRLAYAKQWSVLEPRVRALNATELRRDVALLVGEDFVAEATRAFDQYGRSLGITESVPVPTKQPDPAQSLRALRETLSELIFQLAASANARKPASITQARAALRPVDEFRAAVARRTLQNTKRGRPSEPPPAEG